MWCVVGRTIGFCRPPGAKREAMLYYRRRLPHWVPDQAALFVTWRLAGSLPARQPEVLRAERVNFMQHDEEVHRGSTGPHWLQDQRIADVVSKAILHGESERRSYDLHAVGGDAQSCARTVGAARASAGGHDVAKGTTARRANRILGLRGEPFWQDEFYDHWIRTEEEMSAVTAYVEDNPVKAGLARCSADWPWSSAYLR